MRYIVIKNNKKTSLLVLTKANQKQNFIDQIKVKTQNKTTFYLYIFLDK